MQEFLHSRNFLVIFRISRVLFANFPSTAPSMFFHFFSPGRLGQFHGPSSLAHEAFPVLVQIRWPILVGLKRQVGRVFYPDFNRLRRWQLHGPSEAVTPRRKGRLRAGGGDRAPELRAGDDGRGAGEPHVGGGRCEAQGHDDGLGAMCDGVGLVRRGG